MTKNKVLIFEDSKPHIALLRRVLADEPRIETFFCEKIEDPEDPVFIDLLKRADQFDAIVWDADMWVENRSIFTYNGFIQAFAKVTTKGQPMIANSRDGEHRVKQMEAGCTHKTKEKDAQVLLDLLRKVLGL